MALNSTEDRLIRLEAHVSVLGHLALALFDACPDKAHARSQFLDVTEKTSVHTLYSNLPESFYEAFQEIRESYSQMLAQPAAD